MNKKALLSFVAFCTAFSLTVNSNAAPVDIDRIAAIVDESAIMQSELDARMDSVKRQMGGQMPPDSLLRPQVLERLILENIQLWWRASNRPAAYRYRETYCPAKRYDPRTVQCSAKERWSIL